MSDTVDRAMEVILGHQHAWGAKAPRRKRKKRLAKKLAKRGGYLHHECRGARLAKAARKIDFMPFYMPFYRVQWAPLPPPPNPSKTWFIGATDERHPRI